MLAMLLAGVIAEMPHLCASKRLAATAAACTSLQHVGDCSWLASAVTHVPRIAVLKAAAAAACWQYVADG
jgi:hypothetical protein